MQAADQELLSRLLGRAKSNRVLDLGCGHGEHARFFASQGYDVLAIDASTEALDSAQVQEVPSNLEYILADLGAVERIGRGHFGAAFCLGNTLPYLLSAESLSRLFIGLRRRLLPNAPLVVQLMNYARITRKQRVAHTAIKGDSIVVELIAPVDSSETGQEGIMLHTRASLLHHPKAVPSIEHTKTQAFHLRGWTRVELATSLKVARFSVLETYGNLSGSPFVSNWSEELIIVAA